MKIINIGNCSVALYSNYTDGVCTKHHCAVTEHNKCCGFNEGDNDWRNLWRSALGMATSISTVF